MPYIERQEKKYYNKLLESLLTGMPMGMMSGRLNYIITKIIQKYIEVNGLSYHTINEAIGVLECAKLELYRRLAAPYENKAKKKNGDVY